MPEGIQCSRRKGWNKPRGARYVTRATRFGNPYRVGVDGTATECVQQFRRRYEHDEAYRAAVRAELAGWNLACFCPVGTACHREILLLWANEPERKG